MLRYENRMRFYLERLKDYLKENKADFPEWDERCGGCEPCVNSCNSVKTGRGKIIAGIYVD